MKSLVELRKMNVADLLKELAHSVYELGKLRFLVKSGSDKNVHKVTNLSRYVAQIKTIMKELTSK